MTYRRSLSRPFGATTLPPGYLSSYQQLTVTRRSIRGTCQSGVVLRARARAHPPAAAVRLMRARDVRRHVRSLSHTYTPTHTRAYVRFTASPRFSAARAPALVLSGFTRGA